VKLLPSQQYLHECFSYDPSIGELLWQIRPITHFRTQRAWNSWNRKYAGCAAGCVRTSSRGYVDLFIKLDGVGYLASRLIWKFVTGDDPTCLVDHHDRNGLNNAWENLRSATYVENAANRGPHKNNRLGIKGVFPTRPGLFGARVFISGKVVILGTTFPSPEAASAAYYEKAQEQYGSFARRGE
jgi:hypothetical protein